MEKACLISSKNVDMIHTLLLEFDHQLAMTVQDYMFSLRLTTTARPNEQLRLPRGSSEQQKPHDNHPSVQPSLSLSETKTYLSSEESIFADATPQREPPLSNDTEYYTLTNLPRGLCVIINNEIFTSLNRRAGSDVDEDALRLLFTRFGFDVMTQNNLTAQEIIKTLKDLSQRDFSVEDALVVCVLTHGGKGLVYGSDGEGMKLEELIEPFRNIYVPSLLGKPKLFFIQACQGECYQEAVCPCNNSDKQESRTPGSLEEDCPPEKAVATDADILVGMATVPDHRCYRHTVHGSLYIQELCKQLRKAAER
ncbi:hypothetical protein XENOCAPTIV_005235 [Xenoophorus captivus]|uniref:Caspase-8 n=1 Tax=Xenoophorus captivus TaxID=1517983 RepID=A0ABV0QQ25_9TELE